MATDIADWVETIGMPLVPNLAIKDRVIEIARDFCQHTQLWNNVALTAIDVVAATADYDLASADGDIVGVDTAFYDEVEMNPSSPEDGDLVSTWRTETEAKPQRYMVNQTDSIKLVYTPSASLTGGLVVYASLKPLETATTVPDFIWGTYKKVIRNGVRWLLFDLPGFVWSNPELAERYKLRYRSARDAAASKRIIGRTKGDIRISGGYFA